LEQSTEIYVIRADGTGLRRVTQTRAFVGSPTWSPDGKHILVYEGALDEVGKIVAIARLRGVTQIAVIDLATNEHRVLTSGPGEKWSPQFVADRIAYASGGPDGGVEFVGAPAGARGDVRAPSWSPDARHLVFHRDVEHAWPPFQRWHSNDSQFRLVRTGMFPAYDPAGDRLLSNGEPPLALSKDIVAMNLDGSQRSTFVVGGQKIAVGAVWSPTGDRVAFALGSFFQMSLAILQW
jgi:Tol biopolymer transport system component